MSGMSSIFCRRNVPLHLYPHLMFNPEVKSVNPLFITGYEGELRVTRLPHFKSVFKRETDRDITTVGSQFTAKTFRHTHT